MSKLGNLNHYNQVTFQDLSLNGDASFNNDVFVSNNLVTNNDIRCNNRLYVLGDASLNNNVYVKETFIVDGDASLNANLRVSNDATLNKRLFVSGDASLNSDLYIKEVLLVDGDASLNANLKVSNDATLNDRLFVSGDASFNNDVFISNNLVTNNDIQCNNRLFILGDISWNPNNLANNCIPSTAIIGGAGGSSSFSQNGDDIYFNNGNVGIGIDNPQHNLSIYNTTPSLQLINTSSGSTGNDGMVLEQYELSTYFKNNENGNIFFRTQNNNTRMMIQENGNVGIGTTNPANKLHIYATDNTSNMRINNSTSTSGFILEQSTNKFTYIRNTESAGGMIFHAGNSERMSISNDGRILMTNGLRVQGAYYNFDYNNQYNYYTDPAFTKYHDPGNRNFGVEVDNYLEAVGILLTSDERIKTNIRDLEDDKALQDLRLLCPKIYSYKDTFTRGDSETIGFIAQEVQQVLPRAVTAGTKSIPNILKPAIAHHKENDIFDLSFSVPIDSDITLTSDSTIELDVNGNTIEAKVVSYANGIIEITTEYTEKIKDGDKVVIYGEIVDDFHFLDKNAIFTVATAALQEVDRQLQAEKAKTALLETQMADVLSRLAALEST